MECNPLFDKIFPGKEAGINRREFLENVINENPAFAPAHFLLAAEMPGDEKALRRAGLFFNNPHWLHFQLNPPVAKAAAAAVAATEALSTAEPVAETVQPENSDNNDDEAATVSMETAEAPVKSLPAEQMLFEPMHMVDYFASQGIKLSEEAQAGDKLGKQLKSFTEWLKTMKKVHQQPAEATGISDKKVEQLAEKSNKEDEVLTESMADVLAMQGKKERAREVYEKLSLLNPAKSAYFAAKIEQLKGI